MFYKVVRPFLLASPENWKAYIEFSGLHQLKDFCSLDNSLNASVFLPETPEDWEYSVGKPNLTDLIMSLRYAKKVQAKHPGSRLFGVVIAPNESVEKREKLLGYDIMDSHSCNSLLTGFDGLPEVFDRGLINACGLLDDWKEAYRIRDAFRGLPTERDDVGGAEVWGVYEIDS